MLPLEKLLRKSWNTNKYLTTGPDSKKAFLLEETSKVHVQRISALMSSDYMWAVIAMVALLSGDSDSLGSWAEGCPCHPLTEVDQMVSFSERRKAKECSFRCCRAPELACGYGLKHVVLRLMNHRASFAASVAKAPPAKRSELNSSWEAACSKLFGAMSSHVGKALSGSGHCHCHVSFSSFSCQSRSQWSHPKDKSMRSWGIGENCHGCCAPRLVYFREGWESH